MQRHWRLALAIFCVVVAGSLALQLVRHGPMLELDRDVSFWWAAHRQPWLTSVMQLLTEAHQTGPLLLATAVLMLWGARRRDWLTVRGLLAVPTGMLLNVALKESFQRARPSFKDPLVRLASYSFPSGHAVASTVFWGMACALVFAHTRSRLWRWVAVTVSVVMVLLVCFSRVYLGAHYPSDVIAGIAVGMVCVLGFLRWIGR
jgi:undecaprenyl-diphosphatase